MWNSILSYIRQKVCSGFLKYKRVFSSQENCQTREFYTSLEILRGLCAAEVFLWHICAHINISFFRLLNIEWLYHALFRLAEVSIMTFFIISGFVVTNSFQYYRKTMSDIRAVPFFLMARGIRIWSLTIPVSLVSFFLAQHYRELSGDYSQWGRFYYTELLLKSAFGYSREWNGPGWTLIYELWSYQLLPFLVLVFLARSWPIKAASAGILYVIFYYQITFFNITTPVFIAFFSCFLIGVFSYFMRFMRPSPKTGIVISALGFSCLIVLGQIQETGFDNLYWKIAACTSLFTGFFALNPGNGRFATPLILLGASSYSLYLWHWPIIYFGNFYLNNSAVAQTFEQVVVLLTIQVPFAFFVAWLSYLYIERYARISCLIETFNRLSFYFFNRDQRPLVQPPLS